VRIGGSEKREFEKTIEEIMANRKTYGPACGRKLPPAGAAVLALTVAVVIGLVDVSHVCAQSAEKPAFEVASVKLHIGGTDRNTLTPPTMLPGGRFVSRFPLAFLISYAYKVPFNQNARMTGIPDWAAQGIYDVEATGAMPPGLPIEARNDRVRAMVQALLVDRFKLEIRRESKEMPVYALLVAKGGPKLQRADIDEKDCPEASLNALGPVSTSTPIPDVCHAFNGGMGRGLHSRASSIADLAAFVENWTDRPLLDKTGIRGLYRFETKGWLPMDPSVGAGSSAVADRPTVFQIFEELGLRMEAQKGVVEIYVIGHIEKPSEN
jgi:bla regulator protein blaR1